jgi:hypothetical protein
VKSIFHFSYFDLDFPTSGLTVTGLSSVNCTYTGMSNWYLVLLAYHSAGRRNQLLCLRTENLFAHSSISLHSSFSNCPKTDCSRFWLLWICVHEVRGIRPVLSVLRSGRPDWALESRGNNSPRVTSGLIARRETIALLHTGISWTGNEIRLFDLPLRSHRLYPGA